METTLDRTAEKRRRILEAAWFLVLRHGLRGTTMEALARQAGIAKATLYAQFADKDAVIVAIIDDLLLELQTAYEAGINNETDAAARVGAALAGKYGVIVRSLEGSPHAEEIFNEHRRFAERFKAFDLRIENEIAAVLAQAGVSSAKDLAQVIIAAANGIARKLQGAAQVEQAIRLLCRRMIAPEMRAGMTTSSSRSPSTPM